MIRLTFSKDVNKTIASEKCDICYYWYFLDKRFKVQLDAKNGCHDVLLMSIDLKNIAISNVQGVYYCDTINEISKSEAKNLMQNAGLSEK